jgi:hypothetical protein
MTCDRYNSLILNNFYLELFSSDFNDCESATQNAKTDCLFETNSFNDWFIRLVKTFVEETELPITAADVVAETTKHPEFVSDLKTEYEELKELCDEDDDL